VPPDALARGGFGYRRTRHIDERLQVGLPERNRSGGKVLAHGAAEAWAGGRFGLSLYLDVLLHAGTALRCQAPHI